MWGGKSLGRSIHGSANCPQPPHSTQEDTARAGEAVKCMISPHRCLGKPLKGAFSPAPARAVPSGSRGDIAPFAGSLSRERELFFLPSSLRKSPAAVVVVVGIGFSHIARHDFVCLGMPLGTNHFKSTIVHFYANS